MDSKVQKLSGLVPHESQFSVLQKPVFRPGCILTLGQDLVLLTPPSQYSEWGNNGGGEDTSGQDRTGQGEAGRQTDDTRQLHPLDLI